MKNRYADKDKIHPVKQTRAHKNARTYRRAAGAGGPVLVALWAAGFAQVAEHDDTAHALLPHHLPEAVCVSKADDPQN
jgi:hypothetical protein